MKWILPAAVIAGLFAMAFWSLDAARALAVGWVQFLARVLPRLTWDKNSVVLAVIAFALFTLGVHWLCRALVRWRGSERPWKFGGSVAVALSVVVAFAAGICMIGVVHQSGWLMASEQPMMVEKETWRFQDNSRKNLIGLSLGLQNCLSSYGTFPGRDPKTGAVLQSWSTYASIYYGLSTSDEKGNKLELSLPWNARSNHVIFRGVIPFLINPALPDAPVRDANGDGLAHYAANCRAMRNGVFRPLNEFTDGLANTILIGEVNANFRPWGDPGNVRDPARGVNRSPYGFGGPPGAGGALFAMADGSVKFISEKVSPAVMKALGTPDGGEAIESGVLRDPP